MKSRLALFAVASLATAVTAATADEKPDNCRRCDNLLELSEPEFVCLREKLPTIADRTTRFVFFSLSDEFCADVLDDTVRNADTLLPQIAEDAPKVYKLAASQVACLSAKIGAIETEDDIYRVDLQALCP